MSTGSGLAGLVSGFGSISPGFNFLGSSPTSSSLSLCAALSLNRKPTPFTHTPPPGYGHSRRKSDLQQVLVVLQTLGSSTSYDGSDGPPLRRHQLGQMKQLLLLLSGPLRFLNAGVQPLVPADMQGKTKSIRSSAYKAATIMKMEDVFRHQTHHLALHCLADLRCSREAMRDHWFFPYFITAALRISS